MSKAFYRFMCGVMRPWYAVFLPGEVDGVENIPAEGGFILCCNHISARDPFYLALCTRRHIHFMAKSELFKFKLLGAVLRGMEAFPVDRGHNDLTAVRSAVQLVKDGHGLGIFPQGTRSKKNVPTPMLGGVSLIAMRAGVPVIPAYIGGPYRLFRRTQVSFGPPIDFTDLGRRMDSETLQKATKRIEESIWGLKEA